jgi:hypothetical protein
MLEMLVRPPRLPEVPHAWREMSRRKMIDHLSRDVLVAVCRVGTRVVFGGVGAVEIGEREMVEDGEESGVFV